MFFSSTSKQINKNGNFCPQNSKQLRAQSGQPLPPPPPPTNAYEQPEKTKVTNAWFLVPLIFSIVGGIVGYIMVRKRDKNKANLLLGVGCIVFIIEILLL